MRRGTLLASLIAAVFVLQSQAQQVPIGDFDSGSLSPFYTWGAPLSIEANPDGTPNDSVALLDQSGGAWSGISSWWDNGDLFTLADSLTVDVYANTAGAIKFFADNSISGGANFEQMVNGVPAKTWTTYTLDVADMSVTDYKQFAIQYDQADSIYFDNFTLHGAPTVVDIVVESEDHDTLETAVIAAGLDDDLSDLYSRFTVFAPTDDAFAALPDGALDDLLADPTGELANILLYHVVEGVVMSTDLSDGMTATTMLGKDIEVTISGTDVFINDALVTVADVEAVNGVVHVIDAVLTPPATVVDIVVESEDHDTLETALLAAELADDLNKTGPFTVFAPTDDAFAALPDGLLDDLLADTTGQLAEILLYHVVNASALSTDLTDGQMITTLNGDSVKVTIDGAMVMIDSAMVTVADLETDNGVVHVIDAVLIPQSTVLDIVVGSPDHTVLESAVIAAELDDDLSGEGPFTVFAPTDAAFEALPDGVLDDLLADPTGELASVLLYHVVGAKALSADLSDGQMITTLNGDSVTVSIDGSTVMIDNAMVTVADLEADNGVVHVIDAVILPQYTVMDIITTSADHATLEVAIEAAELDDDLTYGGPLTVFAPTDAAFEALPDGMVDALLQDPTGDLAQILLYHVVGAKALSTDLSDGQMIATLQGDSVMVTIDGATVMINDAMVTLADLEADNGVLHVVDAVLVPPLPPTVFDIIEGSPAHDTLELALVTAGLDETLKGEGPFTVFAPTDDVFSALPAGVLDLLLGDPEGVLTDILLNHVVEGKAMSTDLSDGQVITTIYGDSLTVTIDGGDVFINDAQVIVADLEAQNGVVHVIDMVLLPAVPETVVDIVVESPDHTTLEAALTAAGLAGTLQGDGPFTVFAPTDAAFEALPEGLLDTLLTDPTGDLTDILLYHVVSGLTLSTDLSDGQVVSTLLEGEDVVVSIDGENVFINDAQVTVVDLVAGNGVVHVIDAVLLPATNVRNPVTEGSMITLYPNPAGAMVTLRINRDQMNGDGMLEMVRMDGAVVKSVNINGYSTTIDLDDLSAGVYFMKYSEEGNIFIERLVIQ